MKKKDLYKYMEGLGQELDQLALDIWAHPEVSGQESRSADLHRALLREKGFTIHEIPGDQLENAFYAEYGSGFPVVCVLGEYDALPELSQEASAQQAPLAAGAPGHGCGHNLLGVGSLGAALGAKKFLEESQLAGTIRYYGCPEEETLVGKVRMLQAGAFEGGDLALSWHPLTVNAAFPAGYLANNSIRFYFEGISSHAAQSPESGRSALDSVEIMNVGANYLREHIIPQARVHYTITETGGAPNIVPKDAASWYYVRAPYRQDVEAITQRLFKIAQGAALMNETQVRYEVDSGCYELLPNQVLYQLTQANLQAAPAPAYTAEEEALAQDLQASLDPQLFRGEIKKAAPDVDLDQVPSLYQGVLDASYGRDLVLAASSDSGDVSWNMPMNLFTTATWPLGVPPHSWQATAASGSSLGTKGMLYAAQVMAGMAYDLYQDPDLARSAIEEFKKRTASQPYQSPLGPVQA